MDTLSYLFNKCEDGLLFTFNVFEFERIFGKLSINILSRTKWNWINYQLTHLIVYVPTVNHVLIYFYPIYVKALSQSTPFIYS